MLITQCHQFSHCLKMSLSLDTHWEMTLLPNEGKLKGYFTTNWLLFKDKFVKNNEVRHNCVWKKKSVIKKLLRESSIVLVKNHTVPVFSSVCQSMFSEVTAVLHLI